MRWKFWKKAAPPTQHAANTPSTTVGSSLAGSLPAQVSKRRGGKRTTGQRKKRHFEASCMAGADTGDDEFVFEGLERGAAPMTLRPEVLPPQQPQLQSETQHQQQSSPLPSPPPPRKKQSHTLPRFLRRAASVGRKATSASADTAATNVAAANAAAVAAEKVTTSSDEGFPSTSSGDLLSAEDDAPLGYCPHCRTVVQPLTLKKRSQIRTNPWVKERKRPRIDGAFQKSLDSGIYDENNRARTQTAAQTAVENAKTSKTPSEDLEEEAAGTETDEERPVSLASRPEIGGSDSSTSDITSGGTGWGSQPKRKVRRKRRRRQQSPQQQFQQPEQQWQQRWDTPCASSSDDDFAADAEVLAIHTAASQPLSIVEEGVACMGYVPQQQQLMAAAEVTPVSMSSEDSSSLWWDMDRRHLLLMMAPPPDTSSSSGSLNLTDAAARLTPVLHSETEFDSPPTSSDCASSDSELEFQLLPGSRGEETATPAPPMSEMEESLAETLQRLAAQRESLERRFREPQPLQLHQQSPQQPLRPDCDGGSVFARELERYRRELLIRALASVRDQLDCQMTRLERSCTGAVDRQIRQARENFLRQVSAPCGRLGGGGGGDGVLEFSAQSEESYH